MASAAMAAGAVRPVRYTAVAIALHWLIAAGIVVQILMGLAMVNATLALPEKFKLYQWHKSIGITVLLLVLLRILWRLGHPPPPLPASLPRHERWGAHLAHLALYAFMLFLPLTGWALVSASPLNIPTVLYGVVPWPHLPVLSTLPDKAPAESVLKILHHWGGWLLIPLVLLHAAAALRHHLFLRDGILWRMLPIVRERP